MQNVKAAGREYSSWNYLVKQLDDPAGRKRRERLRGLYFLLQLPEILMILDQKFSMFFSTIGYLGPSRATGERYYRIQELAVDRIDPEGRNVAMFLNSLSPDETSNFSGWAEDALGFSVRTVKERGHVSVILREKGSDEEFNLADVGYGISQILPIMVQVWAATHYGHRRSALTVMAIEQPELHLHPALQAKLADAFVGAVTRVGNSRDDNDQKLALVVETHSQQLINRIGELVHKGKILPEDIAVYVFNKEVVDEPTTISRASFDKDGDLRDWPFGFFATGHEE